MTKKYCCLLLLFYCSLPVFAQKVWPRLNLVQGSIYHQNTQSKTSIQQTINGQQLNMTVNTGAALTFKVITTHDSLYTMQVKYDSIWMKMELPTGDFAFSSEKIVKDEIFSGMLAKLKSQPFVLTITQMGRIMAIDSIEKIIADIADEYSNIADEQKQAIAQITQAFGSRQFKTIIENILLIFPPGPINKNEKWVTNQQSQTTIPLNTRTIYAIAETTPGSYLINGTARINTPEKKGDTMLNGMPVSYSLAGNCASVIHADRKTGWVTKAEIVQNMKGNTTIADNPQLPGGMVIPMTINTTIRMSN